MVVVLDTNVVISGHLKTGHPEAVLLDLLYARRLNPLVSDPVLAEYEEVMQRPKFGFAPARVDAFMEWMRQHATHVVPSVRIDACTDPEDNRFLECAIAGRADALITGNKRHFPPQQFNGIPILNAPEFLSRFGMRRRRHSYQHP